MNDKTITVAVLGIALIIIIVFDTIKKHNAEKENKKNV